MNGHEEVLTALAIGLPATIAALGTLIVSIKTANKANKINAVTEDIKKDVNSNFSNMAAELKKANETIAKLSLSMTETQAKKGV